MRVRRPAGGIDPALRQRRLARPPSPQRGDVRHGVIMGRGPRRGPFCRGDGRQGGRPCPRKPRAKGYDSPDSHLSFSKHLRRIKLPQVTMYTYVPMIHIVVSP